MISDNTTLAYRKVLIDQINECYDCGCVVRMGMLKWGPGEDHPSGVLLHVYDPKTGENHKFHSSSNIRMTIHSSRMRSSYMATKPKPFKPMSVIERIKAWFSKTK